MTPNEGGSMKEYIEDYLIVVAVLFLVLSLIITTTAWYSYQGAKVEAQVYAEQFGAKYTARDFFFAGGEIKKMYESKLPERAKQNQVGGELTLNLKTGDK